MTFHYDLDGANSGVFFLPQVTQKLGPGQITSHRVFNTDAAGHGNDVALITIPLPFYKTSPNPAAADLLNWHLQCIANDAEPPIITAPESTAACLEIFGLVLRFEIWCCLFLCSNQVLPPPPLFPPRRIFIFAGF